MALTSDAEDTLALADFDDAAQERAKAVHHLTKLRREAGVGIERFDHQRDDQASMIALGRVLEADLGHPLAAPPRRP